MPQANSHCPLCNAPITENDNSHTLEFCDPDNTPVHELVCEPCYLDATGAAADIGG